MRERHEVPSPEAEGQVSEMDKKRIIELRGKAQLLKPTVYVGKEGITDTVVFELTKQLRKNKLVKVKLLASVETDKEEVAEQLVRDSASTLIEIRGRTVVLAKE
jgi:RNA-binding protein